MVEQKSSGNSLAISGYQLDKSTEAINCSDFPRLQVSTNGMVLTLTFLTGQRIVFSGAGVSAVLPLLLEIEKAIEAFNQDETMTEYRSPLHLPV